MAATKRATKATAKSEPLQSATPQRKLFVLDTNVFIHDPTSLMRFEEHDVFIPAMVIEELNGLKSDREKGLGRNSRQALRLLDQILEQREDADLTNGIPISLLAAVTLSESCDTIAPTGRLYFQTEDIAERTPGAFHKDIPDNELLAVALHLKKERAAQQVVVVSKDINLRVKAATLGLHADDYKSDQVLDDIRLLYSGTEKLPADFWQTVTTKTCTRLGGYTFWDLETPLALEWRVNQFLYIENGKPEEEYVVIEVNKENAKIRTITDYRKHDVYGITARNREQNFALNALMDPEIDFVTLAGKAGSGKTLLSLAAALHQVLETRDYDKIIFTRETSSLGNDIGFLPGTEEAKMAPWLGALYDNLEVLAGKPVSKKGDPETDKAMKGGKLGNPFLDNAINIRSLNFMQGRTLLRKFFIVDETQNITAKQAKDLVTRAGPGTKVIFLGNLAQVATVYLSGTSSGLAYVVDKFNGYEHGAHITLIGTERSRLADYAATRL